MNRYFIERQKFTTWWAWAIFIIASMVSIGTLLNSVYQQIILGKPTGDNPMPDSGLILTAVIFIAVIGLVFALFITAELVTEVKDKAIYVKFKPFFNNFKRFGKENIKSWEIKRYNPIAQYGGWGVRYSIRNGKAYNVGGKIGLLLTFKDDKKVMIGTQKHAELKRAIESEFSEDEMSY